MANEVERIDESHWDLLRLAGTLEEKRKHIFLRVLAETANLKLAVDAAGYKTTAAVNRARKQDEDFDAAIIEASEAAADMIEAEAVRRAVQGVKKAVYFKGEIVDHEIVYSDSLLQTLLKAAKPEKYAERQHKTVDLTGKIGVAVIPMSVRSMDDWERQAIEVHERQKLLKEPEMPVVEGSYVEVKRA